MNPVIIDYGSGNLRSVAKSFERAAGDRVAITSNPADLKSASHIVLPGVGAFADCMRGLLAIAGMREALEQEVVAGRKPFLGICVGMQLMFEKGFEHGEHAGLGWVKGDIQPIQPSNPADKVPHMGWNDLEKKAEHPLLKDIQSGDHTYFVHSYYAKCNAADVLATVRYAGIEIPAVIGRGHMLGTQFHPEKSQATGLKLIANFLAM